MLIEPFSLSLLFFLQWPHPVQFLAGELVLIFKQDQQQRPRLLRHMVRGRSRIILVSSHRGVRVSRLRSQWGGGGGGGGTIHQTPGNMLILCNITQKKQSCAILKTKHIKLNRCYWFNTQYDFVKDSLFLLHLWYPWEAQPSMRAHQKQPLKGFSGASVSNTWKPVTDTSTLTPPSTRTLPRMTSVWPVLCTISRCSDSKYASYHWKQQRVSILT